MADRQVTFDILARDRASGTLAKVGKGFGGLSTKAVAVGTAIGTLGARGVMALGSLAASAVKTGLSTAASMQQAKIGFESLLGSAEKSQAFVASLSKFAANTPFEFPGLVDASRTLLGVGVASQDVIPMLTDFGDAAGALAISQDGFNRIMLATGQAISAGKFQVGDLNQLMNNGLPVWTLLSKAMGKPVAELRKMASGGKLLAKDVLPILQKQMGKDYGGAMGKQSQTLTGLWSTMKDTFSQGMASVIEPMIPVFQKVLPGAMEKLGKGFKKVAEVVDVFIGAISGNSETNEFEGKLKTLNNTALAVHDSFEFLRAGFTLTSVDAKGMGADLGGLVKVGHNMRVMWDKVVPAAKRTWEAIQKLGGWIKNDLSPAIKKTVQQVMPLFRAALDNLKKAFGSSGKGGADWGARIKLAGEVIKGILKAVVVVVAAMAFAFSVNMRASKMAIDKILIPAIKLIWKVFSSQVGLMLNGAAKAFGWIPGLGPKLKKSAEQFNQFANKVNDAFSKIKGDWYVNVNVKTVSQQRGLYYARKISTGGKRGGRAHGGSVLAGMQYSVNEQGQELLKMSDRSAAVIPHAQSQRMLKGAGGGGDTYIIQAGTVVPERDLMRLLDRLNARGVRAGTRVPVTA